MRPFLAEPFSTVTVFLLGGLLLTSLASPPAQATDSSPGATPPATAPVNPPGNVVRPAAVHFHSPCGVAVDRSGNIYVADPSSATVRIITPDGDVSALAEGAASASGPDGTAAAVRFDSPHGVAVDHAGNVYVADGNYIVLKITPHGLVTTLAGAAGRFGSADGPGTVARFSTPGGLTVDDAGNVYVADFGNHTIRKITPEGIVTTLAGRAGHRSSRDGTGKRARFDSPNGIALDRAGNLYVADFGNSTVRKITPDGTVSTLAGYVRQRGRTDGTGAAARFQYPSGVTVDQAGNVYVADLDNHSIRQITPAGVVTTLAGAAGEAGNTDGAGAMARFYSPNSLTIDHQGNLYVSDNGNRTIRQVALGGFVTTLRARQTQLAAQSNPTHPGDTFHPTP